MLFQTKMLAQEVYSFFLFFLIIGLAVLSNYFLHRIEVKPLSIVEEVIFLVLPIEMVIYVIYFILSAKRF